MKDNTCEYVKIKENDKFNKTIHTSCGYMVSDNEASETICPYCGKVINYVKSEKRVHNL